MHPPYLSVVIATSICLASAQAEKESRSTVDENFLEQLFYHNDKDGSEFLEQGEFYKVIDTSKLDFSDAEKMSMGHAADTDGDGRLTYAEFAPVGMKIIRRLKEQRKEQSAKSKVEVSEQTKNAPKASPRKRALKRDLHWAASGNLADEMGDMLEEGAFLEITSGEHNETPCMHRPRGSRTWIRMPRTQPDAHEPAHRHNIEPSQMRLSPTG